MQMKVVKCQVKHTKRLLAEAAKIGATTLQWEPWT